MKKSYFPHEISAIILEYIKEYIEDSLKETVLDVVIFVLANLHNSQRQATKKATELAGFNVRRIINEPSVAALAYASRVNDSNFIALFDFGGDSFDISMIVVFCK